MKEGKADATQSAKSAAVYFTRGKWSRTSKRLYRNIFECTLLKATC